MIEPHRELHGGRGRLSVGQPDADLHARQKPACNNGVAVEVGEAILQKGEVGGNRCSRIMKRRRKSGGAEITFS